MRCRRGQWQQGSKADEERQEPARSSKARAGEEQQEGAGEECSTSSSFPCVMFGSNRYKGTIVLYFVHLCCLLFSKFVFVLKSGKRSKSKQKSVIRSITK